MPEILLFGLLLVVIYFVSHAAVMKIEAARAKPMGIWRSVWFFLIFFLLLMVSMQFVPESIG